MNRVVLSGRLAGPPRLAYTATGVPVAELRLHVPRSQPGRDFDAVADEFDCLVVRDAAVELAAWGDRGHRVNLEGRLRVDRYRTLEGDWKCGVRVFADCCYFLDPIKEPDVVRLPVPVPLEPRESPPALEEAA